MSRPCGTCDGKGYIPALCGSVEVHGRHKAKKFGQDLGTCPGIKQKTKCLWCDGTGRE